MSAPVKILSQPRRFSAFTAATTVLLVVLLSVLAGKCLATSDPGPARMAVLANAPLCFEANHGQAEAAAGFIARGYQCDVLLAPTEATLVLSSRPMTRENRSLDRVPGGSQTARTRTIRLIMEGANPRSRMTGLQPLPGKANYLLGDNPAEWHTGVPLFGGVKVEAVYPGVDMIYYADQSARLEYDFILQPNIDAGRIAFRVEGADHVSINAAGELVLKIGNDEVRQRPPVLYQDVQGARKTVTGGYRLTGKTTVGFRVGNYDRSLPLVIDPVVLNLSTYFGGSKADVGWAIAVDGTGIYLAGETVSKDLRVTVGALSTTYAGGLGSFGDAFVAKYGPDGTNLIYVTYLGGKQDDAALAMTVANNIVYLTGFTDSKNFPIVPPNNPANFPLSGRNNNAFLLFPVNAFVAALDATGSSLIFSTLIGGSKRDAGEGIAVDGTGVYVAGMTESTNFPVVPTNVVRFQTNFAGNTDAFVAKFDLTGTSLLYSTCLGGFATDFAEGIAVDSSGDACVTGFTASTDFPLLNAITLNGLTYTNLNTRTNFSTSTDAFVSKISSSGTALIYSTYLGGSNNDVGTHIALDSTNNAYVTGRTASRNFPTNTIPLPRSTANNFSFHPFVTKLDPAGSVVYSTQFGGSQTDQGRSIAVDDEGKAYVAGVTSSTNFFARILTSEVSTNCTLVTNCVVVTNLVLVNYTDFRGPALDSKGKKFKSTSPDTIFVAILSADGTAFTTNSFLLGGAGTEEANGIAVDGAGSTIYLSGQTTSPNFPVTTNAPQKKLGNVKNSKVSDAFLEKIVIQP